VAIAPALVDFQRVENQAAGRVVGAVARFQHPTRESVDPPEMFDIDGNGELQETDPSSARGGRGWMTPS